MNRSLNAIILLTLLLGGCDRPATMPDTGGLSQAEFVELFVSLRNAKKNAATPADFEREKREILARAQVTEAQFKSFADAHSEDLSFMAAVWDSIQTRLDRGDTMQEAR